MKKPLITMFVLLPLLFSCNSTNNDTFLDMNSWEASPNKNQTDTDKARSSESCLNGSLVIDNSGLTDDEECGDWVTDTELTGFMVGHTYDLLETPTLTISYARGRVGEYFLAVFEGSSWSGGVPLCSDYFSETDIENSYGGNKYGPILTFKTFTVNFDFNVLKNMAAKFFTLRVVDEDGLEKSHGGVAFVYRFSFKEDNKIAIF